MTVLLEMTREAATREGLLVCAHCGYPRNNHWDWAPYRCAHDSTCPGYEEAARVGRLIKDSKPTA